MRKKIRSEKSVSFDIQSIAMHRMEPKALEIRFQCERKKREQRKAISYFFSFGSATIFIASTSDLSHFQALRHAVDVAVFFLVGVEHINRGPFYTSPNYAQYVFN